MRSTRANNPAPTLVSNHIQVSQDGGSLVLERICTTPHTLLCMATLLLSKAPPTATRLTVCACCARFQPEQVPANSWSARRSGVGPSKQLRQHTWHNAPHLSHLSAWVGRLGIAISRLGILLVSLGLDRFSVKCAANRSLDGALV